jgi:hypothetical protein
VIDDQALASYGSTGWIQLQLYSWPHRVRGWGRRSPRRRSPRAWTACSAGTIAFESKGLKPGSHFRFNQGFNSPTATSAKFHHLGTCQKQGVFKLWGNWIRRAQPHQGPLHGRPPDELLLRRLERGLFLVDRAGVSR